jgi:MFS family permease
VPSPRAVRPGLILALVCAAQFIVILDLAIVNVALPSIQTDLNATSSSLQWVVIAYGLTLGGGLLLGGRIADLFGRRNSLAAGLLVFAVASLVAGVAGSLGVFITARAVQGIGGALALPAALSILTATFPEGPARNKALGVFGAMGGSAGSLGVIAGGALTSGPGWEWVFLINVPVGIVFAAQVASLIPASERAPGRSLDVGGAIAVTAGLMAIVYGINKSAENGWTSATVVGPLVAGTALLAVFAAIESRVRVPLMPRARRGRVGSPITSRRFATASASPWRSPNGSGESPWPGRSIAIGDGSIWLVLATVGSRRADIGRTSITTLSLSRLFCF